MSIEIKKIEAIEVYKYELGLINRRCIGTDIYKVDDIVKIDASDIIALKGGRPIRAIEGRIAEIHDDYLQLDVSEKYKRKFIDIQFDIIASIETCKEE